MALAASQAPTIIVVRLGIGRYSLRSCIVSPTSHKKRVVVSKGNSSPKKDLKESCTKWSFFVETLVLL